jgi:hypothetical protein
MINIEPTKDHRVPFDADDAEPKTFEDALSVAANTYDVLEQLGMPIETTAEDLEKTKRLARQAISQKKVTELSSPAVAFTAREFLRAYGNQLAIDAHEVRSAITAKLMEIANCGDPKYELRALELLGKHSDIGLFTERSEITINYKNSDDLEKAIKERVKRLLNADVEDISPVNDNLDEELGVIDLGDFAPPEETNEPEDLPP